MRCRIARKKLALCAGGEIGGRKARAVEAHSKACPGCRAELEIYRVALARAKSLAASAEPLDWTETEWRRMMSEITAAPSRRPASGVFSLRPALAVAAAFFLFVLGMQVAVRSLLRTSGISTTWPAYSDARPIGAGKIDDKMASVELQRPVASFDRPTLLAVAKIAGLQDPKFPVLESAKQDVPALTMISPETGTKIVWFINENLKLEE